MLQCGEPSDRQRQPHSGAQPADQHGFNDLESAKPRRARAQRRQYCGLVLALDSPRNIQITDVDPGDQQDHECCPEHQRQRSLANSLQQEKLSQRSCHQLKLRFLGVVLHGRCAKHASCKAFGRRRSRYSCGQMANECSIEYVVAQVRLQILL